MNSLATTKADKRVEGGIVPHRVIVNVATRPGDVRGQKRLTSSLSAHGEGVPFLHWTNALPPGSPAHADVPYAFKVYALEEAARRGFTSILWVDASVWFVRSPGTMFDWMEEKGAYTCKLGGGYVIGTWCSDMALPLLGVDRERAFDIPLVLGGCYGISTTHLIGKALLKSLSQHARDGSFRGAWTNANYEVSADPRVKGHRHDMPALSLTVHELDIQMDDKPAMFVVDGYGQSTERAVALCRGVV